MNVFLVEKVMFPRNGFRKIAKINILFLENTLCRPEKRSEIAEDLFYENTVFSQNLNKNADFWTINTIYSRFTKQVYM